MPHNEHFSSHNILSAHTILLTHVDKMIKTWRHSHGLKKPGTLQEDLIGI